MPDRIKTAVKTIVLNSLWATLGRRRLLRLGRFLLNASRLDGANSFATNGETMVQDCIVSKVGKDKRLVAFDVGANVGLWTLSLLDKCRKAQVSASIHCFEPCKETCRTLQDRIAASRFNQEVTCNQWALSSQTGDVELYSLGPNEGRNSLYPLAGEATRTERVKAVTLDEYCEANGIAHVDVIKIDAEGSDYAVMRGGTKLLADQRVAFMQFEYNHRWIPGRHLLKDAFDYLLPKGYRLGKVTPAGIEFYDHYDHELESFVEGNYLAVRAEHAGCFSTIKWWKDT